MSSNWKPRKLVHRPTRKAVAAGIAAQAPPEWEAKPREKKRRKLVEDAVPDFDKLSDDSD